MAICRVVWRYFITLENDTGTRLVIYWRRRHSIHVTFTRSEWLLEMRSGYYFTVYDSTIKIIWSMIKLNKYDFSNLSHYYKSTSLFFSHIILHNLVRFVQTTSDFWKLVKNDLKNAVKLYTLTGISKCAGNTSAEFRLQGTLIIWI